MSSSVFIESSVKSATEAEAAKADSNLVVVYGKNGINFDRKGLKNLIEEKTLSSISVIRLTSPTPSMEAEEEEAEKLEDIGSDEESDVDGERDTATEEEERIKSNESGEDDDSAGEDNANLTDEYDENAVNDGKTAEAGKNKKKSKKKRTSTKLQRMKRQQRRERPEIVGLTVEEFYTAEDANAVLKEALRKAGVSTIKHSAEYEFQLYVIKNDHCYTPFTSPEDMKTKAAAAKPEAEKQTNFSNRKALLPAPIVTKQLLVKKKIQQQPSEELSKPLIIKGRSDVKGKSIVGDKTQKRNESDEFKDEEIHNSTAEEEIADDEEEDDDESEFYESEVSLETDNDRDSDLDFNINNRKGQKRKLKRNKRGLIVKTLNRRHKHSQDDSDEATVISMPRSKVNRSISSDTGRPVAQKSAMPIVSQASTSGGTAIEAVSMPKPISDAIAALPPIPKKQTIAAINSPSPSRQQPVLATTVRRGPIVQVGGTETKSSKIHSSPQTVKEIVISKVTASPKGGFTDIGTLLAQSVSATPTTPKSSTRPQIKISPSSKGFMPLVIESANKNQLPAQISLQTHQSSSELAAEHDKQLDLIDSIVKNEMQKSGIIEQAASVNENIPELVEMLESTAKALELNKMPPVTNYTAPTATTANEDDIDISNTQLLETPEDDIPDDFLQHVVQLMKEDFGDDSSEEVAGVLSTAETPPPLAPIFQQSLNSSGANVVQQQTPPTAGQSTNSIIQMAISQSGTDSPEGTFIRNVSSTSSSRLAGIHTPKTAPLVRKEPIQIVRGNGRVITLPPIEAPTTRAKRRAQTQPSQHSFSAATLNESSLDSSLQSNSSFTAATISDTGAVAEKKPAETPAKRRVSKESTFSAGAGKSAKKASAKKANTNKSNANKGDNAEPSVSHGDDDDPNKLWCICRQPHNNRFMICCDICEDWFHGTCVNITKAMGLQMEQKSIDWTCPKCVKAQEEKKQRKITDMLLLKKTPEEHLEEQIAETATMSTTNKASESIDMNVELVAQTTSIPKPEATVKKQLIEIKKIQSGQFISLKSLELAKKSTSPVVTCGPKRMFPPSQTQIVKAGDSPATPTQVKRVIVQNVHKSKAPTAGAPQPDGGTSLSARAPLTQCIVCKKVARPNSIYCSDDCIRRHAQNALQAFTSKSPEPSSSSLTKGVQEDKKKKGKGLFEDLLLMADRKPKVERVHVFERMSGRVLTGHSAPTTANLKKWLQDNPTFEVVQPGSVQALEIEKKQKQRTMHSASPTANKSFSLPQLASPQNVASPQPPHTKSLQTTPAPKAEMVLMYSDSPKPVKQLVASAKMSPKINRPTTPKQLNKYPSQVSIRPPDKVNKAEAKDDTKTKEKALKRQSSDSGGKKFAENTPSTDSEPIRLNVRRTLKEQLLLRINELPANEARLTAEEVKHFVIQTEAEMYSCFNRDTGAKYRAKYRSLMFNIKDRKNHTLFPKICAKQIGAKQLVHMSADDLASQELAQWRENEAKHQLEMIKKSELDMLSCAKNYVLKTHKGEEVIEDKLTDRVNLDLTIPVEDVVSVLNNDSAVGSSDGDLDRSGASTGTYTKKDYTHSSELHSSLTSSFHHVENSASEKSTEDHGKVSHRDKERDKELERGHDREKRHKSKDRHRDKSRSRRRSRSRSRSRSHSREKRHKSSHKDERRERDERRDRSVDREGGRERAREREHKDDADHKSLEKKIPTTSSNSSATSSTAYTKSSYGKEIKKKPATPKPLGTFSLIDQILESSKTIEEAANLVTEKELPRQITPPPTSTSSATLLSQEHKTQQEEPSTEDTVDYDEEPTSTVSIATPPQDPYLRYSGAESPASSSGSLTSPINAIWGGNINMIDVASFQIILQSVVGNAVNLGKLLPLELDVVGRIGPDTVWDYISKIKKSPNKEIVIIRLLPSNETETSAYTILYQYLDKRKRLGVIKTASSQIKDFYIYPLGAGKRMPPILQSTERVDFYEDASRPDMLVGIVIRVIGKRNLAASIPVLPTMVPSAGSAVKFPRGPIADAGSFTPPGSPKRRKTIHSTKSKDDEIDIDAIIKAPIAAKTHKSSGVVPAAPVASAADEADEPYSPGGSSDDDMPMLPVKTPSALLNTNQAPNYELKRKMDELNRQIAAQEMEIAGLLNVEPSRYASSSTKTSTVLANISIPSNLSQILASIKSKPESHSASLQTGMPPPPHIGSLMTSSADDEEYNPEEAITNISYESPGKFAEKPSSGSRLAQLSEAELLSMVPDDMMEETSPPVAEKKSRFDEPPPPGV